MRRLFSLSTVLVFAGGILAMSFSSAPGTKARAEAFSPQPEAEAITAELTTILVDNYGYIASPVAQQWVDVTSGTQVPDENFYPDSDDVYVGPFSLGFNFPFYEKIDYTQLRISTNGYLTLDGAVSEQLIRNLDLPSDQKPNSLIAPFWDDLTKGATGELYYLGTAEYFAVQWDSFSRFNETPTVTFQVVLFKNGDILFQYGEMNGNLLDASVGIEDGDGVDGISYLFNGTGTAITSSSAIRFTRPGAGRRAKLTPLYAGGFIVAGKAQFDITLTNTGNVTSGDLWDSYQFTSLVESVKPGWRVVFLLNGQPVTNSGPLTQGTSQVYQVLVYPPDDAVVGDHAIFDLVATSDHDTNKSATVSVQVAVPARFMHAYADAQGMHLGRYWKENEISTEFASFTENVALAPAGDQYVMVWDIQEGVASNLSYVVINPLGMPAAYVSRLEDKIATNDRFPSLASGSGTNHQVVVVWPQYTYNANDDPVFDLMLTLLNPDLENPVVISPPIPVVDNSLAYTISEGVKIQDASAYWVDMDKVWIIWTEQRFINTLEDTTDIRAGLYNLSSRTWVGGPLSLKEGSTSVYYSDPTLIGLADGNVLAFFSALIDDQKTKQIYWASLGTAGQIVKLPTALGVLQGGSLDAILLDEKIMLAWVTPDRGAVAYNLLSLIGSGATLSLVPGVTQSLVLENHNLVEHISLFADQDDRGILTWKNVDHSQMYYALVETNGALGTPAVMFFRDPSAGIMVSKNGQSSTLYTGTYRIELPIISK